LYPVTRDSRLREHRALLRDFAPRTWPLEWAYDPLYRDLSTRFGDESYATEELIAEITAAFLCAHLEIPGKLRHTEYIASWLRVLEKDKKAIFTAARKATEAAEYLRSLNREKAGHE
jgi:antirestriction protein ArdC